MNVYIKAGMNGMPYNLDAYSAYLGFKELGYECIFFKKYEDLMKIHHDIYEPIVADSEIVERRLNDFGIKSIDKMFSDEIYETFGRLMWKTTIRFLKSHPELWPVSIQSLGSNRLAQGFIRSADDFKNFTDEEEGFEVLCSIPIDFVTECRVFVRYGKILDVRPYEGEWSVHCDTRMVERTVQKYKSAPNAYSLDFGVTEEGETLLIRINEAYFTESYGLSPNIYARFLITGWKELIKNQSNIYSDEKEN